MPETIVKKSNEILPERYGMERKVFTSSTGETLPVCFRKTGDWNSEKKAAVVLFLHGAGERGTDNCSRLVHCARELTGYCGKNAVKALLLFPQCPENQQWVDTPWNAVEHTLPPESGPMRLAMEMLDVELRSPEADLDRVYICGISMGGYGAWDAISRFFDKFAAAFIICGGVDVKQVGKFKNLPLLFYHGDADTVVPVERSRRAAAALKAVGAAHFRYVELPECGHGSWGPAFAQDANWAWLFSNKRP